MRWILRVVLALVSIVVVGLGVVLVPPHVQIRGIAPALPSDAELMSLLEEPDGPVGLEMLVVATQDSARGRSGHSSFVVRWADGRRLLIDAGMDEARAAAFAETIALIVGPGEHRFLGNVADQLGPAIQDVRAVGFTHLHIDHVEGLGVFCAARGSGASVYQTRWQAEERNLHTTEGAGIVGGSCLKREVLPGEGLAALRRHHEHQGEPARGRGQGVPVQLPDRAREHRPHRGAAALAREAR